MISQPYYLSNKIDLFINIFFQLDNRRLVLKRIKQVKKAYNDQIPPLDPITDMNINLPEFAEIVKKIQNLENQMKQHPLHGDKELPNLYQQYSKKSEVI